MRRNVALLLFDDVEVLDFAGPFEVFALTDQVRGHDAFNVFTVAESPATIRACNGLKIVPDFTLETCPPPHVLIVPGGLGTRPLLKKPAFLEWVRVKSRAAELTMSVCTGSLVLAQAGLLDGLRATTHHRSFALLRELAPRTEVVETERFIDNPAQPGRSRIVTSAGISAGIDCSLYVVAELLGAGAADETARRMEYRRS